MCVKKPGRCPTSDSNWDTFKNRCEDCGTRIASIQFHCPSHFESLVFSGESKESLE